MLKDHIGTVLFIGAIIVVLFIIAVSSKVNPYSYHEISNVNNSVVVIDSGKLSLTKEYGYYFNGQLVAFNKCENIGGTYRECSSPNGSRTLKYSYSKYGNFHNPSLTIDGFEHQLICKTTFINGEYCVIEKDSVKP